MDVIASIIALINAMSMAIMGASALAWGDTTETRIYVAVALLQLLVLFGELRETVSSYPQQE